MVEISKTFWTLGNGRSGPHTSTPSVSHFAKAVKTATKAIYARDPLISGSGGVIVGRLAPLMQRGEEVSITQAVGGLGIPILRTITGTGPLEGGSFAKLSPHVAVFATSIRWKHLDVTGTVGSKGRRSGDRGTGAHLHSRADRRPCPARAFAAS